MRPAMPLLMTLAVLASIAPSLMAQETFYSPAARSHRDEVAAQAALVGELAENHRRAAELRSFKEKAYREALYQIEASSVPFPDDPPIRYPNIEAWRALTARRAAAYGRTEVPANVAPRQKPARPARPLTSEELNRMSLQSTIDYLTGAPAKQ